MLFLLGCNTRTVNMSSPVSFVAKCFVIFCVFICVITARTSELKMADGPDDKLMSFPISEVAAKPGDALMKCVKKYSKQEQCMTCVGKESAGGHVQQQLTKLIAHDHIIWTQVNATVVDCRDCKDRSNVTLLDVTRMPNELLEILKWILWLEYEQATDSYHVTYDRGHLAQEYASFKAKYGCMTDECLRVFGIPKQENHMPERKDDHGDDDDDTTFIKHMAYLAAGVLSGLSFVAYIMRQIWQFYRDTVQLRRDYSNLVNNC